MHRNGSLTALCEVQLLQSSTINLSCKTELSDPGPHRIHTLNTNLWIYSVADNYIINTVCGSTPDQLILNQSGILTLQADCSIKQPKLTIQGYQKFETTGFLSYIPSTVLTQILQLSSNKSRELKLKSSMSLADLHQKLKQIRVELPNELRPHDIHHYTLSYICVASLIIIAVVVYNRLRNNKVPRSKTNAEAGNITLDPISEEIITIPV